jgi:uncharacterized integral membrane protein
MPAIAIVSFFVTDGVLKTLSTSAYYLVRDVAQTRAYVYVVNLVPPFLTGFACTLGLVRWLTERGHSARRVSHLAAWPLYAGFLVLAVYVYVNRGSHDFGYVGQLFVWPAIGFLGAALGDLVAGRVAGIHADPGRRKERVG